MNQLPYNPRDSRYKFKFGALAAGEPLRLRLLLPSDAGFRRARLKIRRDDRPDPEYFEMSPGESFDRDSVWWACELTRDTGLYWYSFLCETEFGEKAVTRFPYEEGYLSDAGTEWQLTVFDPQFSTPGWLSGGILYQIFPDRFYSSGREKSDVPADRCLRSDWGGQPAFRQGAECGDFRLGNDYFGGDLAGIAEKLDYLKELGVTCLYLNPVFEAHSNHRYNTADYLRIDPLLGTDGDLRELCEKAAERGMRVILDGVFSHTGDDSRYFNRQRRYPDNGAAGGQDSPYYSWYSFTRWPDEYKSWWGVPSLPEVNELDEGFDRFICGEDGVLRHWLRQGISGWRLDVADELPDEFLDHIRAAIKSENPDAYLLGEVWEDASNKISYGKRRRFLLGNQLDSVMNYPFREAILRFLEGGNSRNLMDSVLTVLENYPPPAIDLLMNHIGTHDTPRILTVLGGEPAGCRGREWQAGQRLTAGQRAKGLRFLKLAATLQFTLPGVPSIYYGDEVGMEGYGDPFCRACYPWGGGNRDLLEFYRFLGKIRRDCSAFAGGEFIPVFAESGHIAYLRKNEREQVLVAVNRWCDPETVALPPAWDRAAGLSGRPPVNGVVTVPAEGISILRLKINP